MRTSLRFWLDRGVDGFRLDVINWIVKDDAAARQPDRALLGRRAATTGQRHVYDRNRPEAHRPRARLRRTAGPLRPERMMVGEVYNELDPATRRCRRRTTATARRAAPRVQLLVPVVATWNAAAFRARGRRRWETLLPEPCWPTYTLGNHDQRRAAAAATTNAANGDARGRVAAALVLLTLRGTPFLYYGEEIGMRDGKIPHERAAGPARQAVLAAAVRPRPGAHADAVERRTPTPASRRRNRGCRCTRTSRAPTSRAPRRDPESLLHWYRALIRIRRDEPALQRGSYRRLAQGSGVLGWVREHEGDRIAVLLNFESRARQAALPAGATWRILAASARPPGERIAGGTIELDADGVIVAKAAAPQARTLGSEGRARSVGV